MRYRLNLSFGLLFLAVSAGGQTQPCELDIPLNIVMPDLALVRNMHQDGFIAHRGSEVLPIRSVNEDTASRRIVVVVENGKNVNPGARKVEVSILGAIVKNARAEDSFALLTAIGPLGNCPLVRRAKRSSRPLQSCPRQPKETVRPSLCSTLCSKQPARCNLPSGRFHYSFYYGP